MLIGLNTIYSSKPAFSGVYEFTTPTEIIKKNNKPEENEQKLNKIKKAVKKQENIFISVMNYKDLTGTKNTNEQKKELIDKTPIGSVNVIKDKNENLRIIGFTDNDQLEFERLTKKKNDLDSNENEKVLDFLTLKNKTPDKIDIIIPRRIYEGENDESNGEKDKEKEVESISFSFGKPFYSKVAKEKIPAL